MTSCFKKREYDVVIIGCGNAALTAALSTQEYGGSVLVLEKSPKEEKGGNTKHTGFFRHVHAGKIEVKNLIDDFIPDDEWDKIDIEPYTKDMFYNDIMRQSGGRADPELSEVLINNSLPVIEWMKTKGIKWGLNYNMVICDHDRLRWMPASMLEPKGAGAGLVEMLVSSAEKNGVEIVYDAMAIKLVIDSNLRVTGVVAKTKGGLEEVNAAKGVILACGGFEASPEMRARYLGPGWDIVKVRGTQYNTGEGLTMALALGAKTTGEWTGCHAAQMDATAPDHDAGLEGSRPNFNYGILVDIDGKRFVDEGEDLIVFTYVKIGRIILRKPDVWACQIFDQKTTHLLGAYYQGGVPPVIAETIEELAEGVGLDPTRLVETINRFNSAVQEGNFSPGVLDGKKTLGIEPPKSNWALKIDTPPFVAYPVTTGITFTFGGLQVNRFAQVLDTQNNPIPGLYATGEIMGSFYFNYPGATGLMKGAVFGRIAGAHAMGYEIC